MRIEGLISEYIPNQANISDILGKLNIGDVIKARVLEMTSDELLLRLFDGSVFKAAAASKLNVKPGDMIELSLTGRNEGRILLETVKNKFDSSKTRIELKNLLLSLKIKPDSKNLKIASEIEKSGLKLTADLVRKASELMNSSKSIDAEKAVYLAANGIKPGKVKMETVLRFLEGRLKIGDQLNDIIKQLEASVVQDDNSNNEVLVKPDDISETVIKEDNMEISDSNSLNSDENVPANKTETGTDSTNLQGNIARPGTSKDRASAMPVTVDSPEGNTEDSPKMPVSKSTRSFSTHPEMNLPADATAAENDIIKSIAQNNKENSILETTPNNRTVIERAGEAVNSIFLKADSGSPESNLNVNKLYRDIVGKLDALKNVIQTLSISGDKITAQINSIHDGIQLQNQINNNYSYVQIPLNIAGFNTTGELYVMKREHQSKKYAPGDVVAFLSLDTRNIGRVESLVSINGRNVSLNMRAEDQQVVDFMKENFKDLYNALNEQGYRLVDIKYRLIQEKTNPLNVETVLKDEMQDRRIFLDMRI